MTNKEKQFATGWKEYQAKKKQAIEEIHNFILETYDYNSWDKARAFYNAGYQKVNKDNVVLSKEEYNELIKIKENCLELMKQGEQQIVNISKETVERFYDKVMSFIGSNQKFWIVDNEHITIIEVDKLFDFVMETAKQFGVKIKE